MTSHDRIDPAAAEAEKPYGLPAGSPAANHGKTTAAWALLWLVAAGSLAIALALMLWQLWLVAVGVALIVAGLLSGQILRAMGLGQPVDAGDVSQRDADWYG